MRGFRIKHGPEKRGLTVVMNRLITPSVPPVVNKLKMASNTQKAPITCGRFHNSSKSLAIANHSSFVVIDWS